MGGNLFKLGRLPRAEYLALESEMRQYLDEKFGDKYRIPRYYGDKADFGDMDILLSAEVVATNWETLRDEIMADLGITECVRQPKLLSTVYRDFQVDFFIVQPQYFQTHWQFLCYNDLGNLLGKLFRRFNLKYGEKGLWYVFRRADEHYRVDIPLTRDMREILAFLGLKFERWDQGFANLEDMFAWVVSSPYFTVKPFLNRSASTEKRLRERSTMRKFIEWLQANHIDKAYDFAEDRSVYLPKIAAEFPHARLPEAIAYQKEREQFANENRAKFNGRIVMGLFPTLSGKDLGRFIQQFKEQFDDFEARINALTAEEIRDRLQQFWEQQQAP